MNVNLFCMSTTSKHLLHERKQCLLLSFKNYIYEFEHPFLGGRGNVGNPWSVSLLLPWGKRCETDRGFSTRGGGGCLLALVIFYCSEFKLSLSIQFIFKKKINNKIQLKLFILWKYTFLEITLVLVIFLFV